MISRRWFGPYGDRSPANDTNDTMYSANHSVICQVTTVDEHAQRRLAALDGKRPSRAPRSSAGA